MPFLNLALFMIWFLISLTSENFYVPFDMLETDFVYITKSLGFYCVCSVENDAIDIMAEYFNQT